MISSQGNTIQLSNGMIFRATIGQNVIGNSSQKDIVVQQGFQQSYWSVYIAQSEQNAKKTVTTTAFPNPFIDLINFRFSGDVGTDVALTIFDVTGRLVVSRTISVLDNQIAINLSNLAKAEYLVRLSSERLEYYVKIIKQ